MSDTAPQDEPERDRTTRHERVAAFVVAALLGAAGILTAVVVGQLIGAGAALISLVVFGLVILAAAFDWLG